MIPVVGLDVAKGVTEGQAFLDKGRPYGPHFQITHTAEGLEQLQVLLDDLAAQTHCPPTVILESTGHYHVPVVRFLEDHGYAYVLLNPLIPYQAKQSSLRKVKTDAVDAFRLGQLFYKEELEPLRRRGQQLLDLRHLTRQREAVTGLFVQAKLQFHALLDSVFPEYAQVFSTLFSQVSLRTLEAYSTADAVLAAAASDIAGTIRQACPSRPVSWAEGKAQQLIAAAHRNPMRTADLPHQVFSVHLYIRMIGEYQAHLATLDREFDTLVHDIEACQLIQTIPEIGATLAATIMAEIGEIARFDDARKLVAFAGVDPSVHQSGHFTATVNRITKRGSSRLRHALFVAAMCGLRASGSKRMQAFYQAKRAAGKPHKVALVACINKLLHWIYAVLTRREAFVDVA